jgi:urease accessory protein
MRPAQRMTFPIVMAFGGMLGLMGIPLPGVEIGIAASAIILGFAVLTEWRPPLWVAAIVVGSFTIFHGLAQVLNFRQAQVVFSIASALSSPRDSCMPRPRPSLLKRRSHAAARNG